MKRDNFRIDTWVEYNKQALNRIAKLDFFFKFRLYWIYERKWFESNLLFGDLALF